MDKKARPLYILPPRDPSQIKRYTQAKSKGWKKIFHANGKEKKAGVAVLISDKIDFKTKAIVKDTEGHYMMIKETIQQDDITIVNIYATCICKTNNKHSKHTCTLSKYVKQILMDIKGETDRNTVIVGDFNTTLTSVDRSFRQKINKETAALNDTLGQMGFIDIFRAFHPKAAG